MAPQLIFGTASFGMDLSDFQDAESVKQLLKTLQELGINRLDSAPRYPPLKPGRSEELIGETKELSESFLVDTKIYTNTQIDSSGDLSRENIEKSVNASLQRLKRPDGLNVLHIHRADPSTPLEEQIQAFNEQTAQGHCKAWGVSNVPPEMLEKVLRLCEQNSWQKPSCYQGDYNLITRGMETKLLRLLHAHNMTFNAFRPLAAGFLTGKLVNNQHAGTRFGDDNPLGKAVQKLFGADDVIGATKKFDTEAKAIHLRPMEIAIRWIIYHSALRDEDGVILGASNSAQVSEIVSLINKGPLPDEALKIAEELWLAVRGTRGEII